MNGKTEKKYALIFQNKKEALTSGQSTFLSADFYRLNAVYIHFFVFFFFSLFLVFVYFMPLGCMQIDSKTSLQRQKQIHVHFFYVITLNVPYNIFSMTDVCDDNQLASSKCALFHIEILLFFYAVDAIFNLWCP